MSRVIKFRMWDTEANKYFTDPAQVIECLSQQLNGVFDHEKNGSVFEQFTGLHDKNGKEIYEGDILSTFDGNGIVSWDEYDCSFVVSTDTAQAISIAMCIGEIIGNIHENGDLLK